MSRVRVDTMIEALNDLGFALWATGQAHQAKGALTECQALLTRSAGSRPLLELNLGDVEKDLGNVAAAREHYETFLKLPSSHLGEQRTGLTSRAGVEPAVRHRRQSSPRRNAFTTAHTTAVVLTFAHLHRVR